MQPGPHIEASTADRQSFIGPRLNGTRNDSFLPEVAWQQPSLSANPGASVPELVGSDVLFETATKALEGETDIGVPWLIHAGQGFFYSS